MPSTYIPHHEASSTWSMSGALYGVLGALILTLGTYLAIQYRSPSTNTRDMNSAEWNQDTAALRQFENQNAHSQNHEFHRGPLIQDSKDSLEKSEVELALSATVFIQDATKLGSGFLITSDGYILSNAHVTADMQTPIVILNDGRQYEAKKIRDDRALDISLIKIDEKNLTFLKLGDANQLYPGQAVVAVGNPGGLSFTVTRGIVSYVGRNLNGVPYIQTDAAINRGNSGGPMINSSLEVVGINTLTSTQEQGISFSLPINFVCSDSGIATDIATVPSSCPVFKGKSDTLVTAAINHGGEQPSKESPKGESPLAYYNQEADSLRQALDRDENGFKSEESRLKADLESAKASLQSDPYNGSLQDRVTQKTLEIQQGLNSVNKRRAQSQISYIKKLRSLMEQQRGDPAFSKLVAAIDSQIQGLKAKEQELQTLLEKLN